MTAGDLRALELTGPQAAAALDWLHVHADVRGVVEGERAFTVFVAGPLPSPPMAEVVAREVPVDSEPRTGLEHDAVIRVAPDLIVRPPWVDPPADFEGVELVVPRGAAFGSGEHDSTQAALCCVHALWNGPSSCADVGTGSGILALYATVRGATEVRACDIEAPAVAAARELLPDAVVELGGPELLQPADCVIANMTGDELAAALPQVLRLWRGHGPFVLSGMREGEVDRIRGRLPRPPDEVVRRGAFTALGLARY